MFVQRAKQQYIISYRSEQIKVDVWGDGDSDKWSNNTKHNEHLLKIMDNIPLPIKPSNNPKHNPDRDGPTRELK